MSAINVPVIRRIPLPVELEEQSESPPRRIRPAPSSTAPDGASTRFAAGMIPDRVMPSRLPVADSGETARPRRLPLPQPLNLNEVTRPRRVTPVSNESATVADIAPRRIPLRSPAEMSIEAEPPPEELVRRIGPRDLHREVVDEGLGSSNPAIRRIALRESGVPVAAQDLISAGTPRPEMKPGKKGFLGRLGSFAKGAALGARYGPGGMIAGGVQGAISPDRTEALEYRDVTLPRWEAENQRAQQEAAARLDRAKDYAAISGIDPLSGRPTPTQQRITELGERNDELARQANERLRQGQERLNQSERRAQAAERNSRISRILAAGRIPGRAFSDETRAELQELLGVDLPREFNPATHDIRQDESGAYFVLSVDRATGQPTVQQVTGPDGKPLVGPKRAGERPNWSATRARARAELYAENGITNPNALVDNPLFGDAFNREKAADSAAASAGSYAASSDAEIRRRIVNKLKIPEKVRASSLVTDDQVEVRAGEIYERESGRDSQGRSSQPQGRKSTTSYQMNADEADYQQLYPGLSPEQRKMLEDAFEKDYGRKPRAPGR